VGSTHAPATQLLPRVAFVVPPTTERRRRDRLWRHVAIPGTPMAIAVVFPRIDEPPSGTP
jgi:hypothetical protein